MPPESCGLGHEGLEWELRLGVPNPVAPPLCGPGPVLLRFSTLSALWLPWGSGHGLSLPSPREGR